MPNLPKGSISLHGKVVPVLNIAAHSTQSVKLQQAPPTVP